MYVHTLGNTDIRKGSLAIKAAEYITPLLPIHATPARFNTPSEADRDFWNTVLLEKGTVCSRTT